MYPVFLLPGDVPEESNKSKIDLINKKHMTEEIFSSGVMCFFVAKIICPEADMLLLTCLAANNHLPRILLISRIKSGVVPQHPPITDAPFSIKTFICSAKFCAFML